MSNLICITLSSLKIAFMSFGGGNAVAGLIEEEFVEKYKLVSSHDFQNLLSLTNMFPGPISLNFVTLLSYRTAGFLGASIAFIIILFPGPLFIVLFATILHKYIPQDILLKATIGITPVIIAMLIEFIVKTYRKQKVILKWKYLYVLCFLLTLFLLIIGVNIVFIMIFMILSLAIIAIICKKYLL